MLALLTLVLVTLLLELLLLLNENEGEDVHSLDVRREDLALEPEPLLDLLSPAPDTAPVVEVVV